MGLAAQNDAHVVQMCWCVVAHLNHVPFFGNPAVDACWIRHYVGARACWHMQPEGLFRRGSIACAVVRVQPNLVCV